MENLKSRLSKLYWSFLDATYRWWPDSMWLKIVYKAKVGRQLNLRNPQTFSEKLNWLKIHDHNPRYVKMVDKYDAKEYVKDLIGHDVIIPTYGVWNHFDDIDFDSLPNQFVLKCTHDSGGIIICKDKERLDKEKARNKLESALKLDYWCWSREWAYKSVKPRIIAEKYIEDQSAGKDLVDYKFYCFHGKAMFCQVITNRSTDETIDFYDTNWVHQPFVGLNPKAHNAAKGFARPLCYDKMLDIANKLSADIGAKFVRIDLYDINEHIYFGEITFYPNGGTGSFSPQEWDYKMGGYLDLSV